MRRQQYVSSTGRVRTGALWGALFALLGLGGACGGFSPEGGVHEDVITVRPRVALEGLIELSARTDGRLFVDEVVFHAPAVHIHDGPFPIADLLATDPDGADPLFFRYSLAEGGSEAIANERRWQLGSLAALDAADISFGFAPFAPSRAELSEMQARTSWDLALLSGYTAYIHGYVSVTPADLGLRETKGSFGHGQQRFAGDSEGDPARGQGERLAGDAEGDPARTRDDCERLVGDAEGDPARSAGDPEGDPARSKGSRSASFDDRQRRDGVIGRPGASSDGELVPFLLVFDGAAELRVPVAELGLAELDEDEFLPIDLHVNVNALLPDHRLADLDGEAAEVVRGATDNAIAILEVDPREVGRSFALDLDTARKRKPTEEKPRLQLTGDPRH